jgi:hypothetical protein
MLNRNACSWQEQSSVNGSAAEPVDTRFEGTLGKCFQFAGRGLTGFTAPTCQTNSDSGWNVLLGADDVEGSDTNRTREGLLTIIAPVDMPEPPPHKISASHRVALDS